MMGSPKDEIGRDTDEGPVHEVCVDVFWMGTFEVTNKQYRTWKQEHDSEYYSIHSMNDKNQPAISVSWEDATAFAAWLTKQNGGQYTFRLPTEAEWEYAARAGTSTTYFWGNDQDNACLYANAADKAAQNAFEWNYETVECNDSFAVTASVGSFQPNGFGLYDMLGNAWEWCQDWYSDKYYSESPKRNPKGPLLSGSFRVLRGGSWRNGSGYCRSADRFNLSPDYSRNYIGFRLVRTP